MGGVEDEETSFVPLNRFFTVKKKKKVFLSKVLQAQCLKAASSVPTWRFSGVTSFLCFSFSSLF